MPNTFFCSDHHFHHANILNFKRDDGSPLREFESAERMNEYMVQQHNSVVKPKDKVYFLGDVCMSTKSSALETLARMNGEKILIKGNHDLCKPVSYLQHFKDIRGSHQFDGMILTHIPIHADSLARWGLNVHGHLHHREVMIDGTNAPDYRYFSVCMERLDDYKPISLEQIKKITSTREAHSPHYYDTTRNR